MINDHHPDKSNGPWAFYDSGEDTPPVTPPEYKEYNARARAAQAESPFYGQPSWYTVLEKDKQPKPKVLYPLKTRSSKAVVARMDLGPARMT